MKNKGVVTVEASLAVPLFLFFWLALTSMLRMHIAEAHIHQSLAEAAVYTAQYEYLEQKLTGSDWENGLRTASGIGNAVIMRRQFQTYLMEDQQVLRIVEGGCKGIRITIRPDPSMQDVWIARADFAVNIPVPLMGTYRVRLHDIVKQKAFTGYRGNEAAEEDYYVYVTPNEAVYHMRRSCTHLSLSYEERSSGYIGNLQPCGFCGKKKLDHGQIYVSRTTRLYHYRKECSGLKRTVYRVRKSRVPGLVPCGRCGTR